MQLGLDERHGYQNDPPHRLRSCPVCAETELSYAFQIAARRADRCPKCDLLFLNPQPGDEELQRIYDKDYLLGANKIGIKDRIPKMKEAGARTLLECLYHYAPGTNWQGKRLLDIGCGAGFLLAEAEKLGFEAVGIEQSQELARKASRHASHAVVIQGCAEEASLPYESFDAVILSDVIEHVRDPLALLRMTRQWLRPGGILLVATPSLKSPSFQFMRTKWMEFKTEHLTYFSPSNLQMALYKSGFAGLKTYPQRKALSIEYIQEHFSQYPSQSTIARLGLLLIGSLPAGVKQRVFRVGGAGMVAMATKSNDPEITVSKLSVIVPVYNERSTVGTVISELMKKRVFGLETEIIVVESNSNDGSREQVLQYEGKPGIVLVFQDTARGKGHAVRAGLQVASGDIILIQDADLEYDLWDYEALIRPLVQFRRSFVLGTRHKGNSWKMRRFIASPFLAWIINAGHKMLTSCFNILYRQHVEDPFTMFKVFRRDCLKEVVLECDHFDFDIELVIKLLMQGFEPLEVPVNYVSRSFSEGKKVRFFRDPVEIMRAMIKFRFE